MTTDEGIDADLSRKSSLRNIHPEKICVHPVNLRLSA